MYWKIWIVLSHLELLKEQTCSLQMHLFDIDIPGDITLKESDFFAAGDKPTIVDTGIYCWVTRVSEVPHWIKIRRMSD